MRASLVSCCRTTMAEDLEQLFSKIQDFFNITSLKPFQKRAISHISEGKDVFLCAATGGGKSIVYQSFAMQENAVVLVFSPLVAIMKEQVDQLRRKDIGAAFIGGDEDAKIQKGEINAVFTSPEALLSDNKWRQTFMSDQIRERVKLVVVDEAHSIIHWGQSKKKGEEPFRVWFSQIGEVRSLLPDTPILALTATASKRTRTVILKKLAMHDAKEIIDNPDRSNIKLFRTKFNANKELSELFGWINPGLCDSSRIIIFTKTIKDCAAVYNSLQMKLSKELVDMFHSCSTEATKTRIRLDMADIDGKIRVLVATDAAGMGVNYEGIDHVVNFGPPQEMDTLLQHIGRAGRDGRDASHLLLFNGRQLRNCSAEVLAFSKTPSCLRKTLLAPYNCSPLVPPNHACCDICTAACECEESENHVPHISVDQSNVDDEEIDWLDLTQDQLSSIRLELEHHQTQSPFMPCSLSPFSDQCIEEVVENANKLTSADDILEQCECVSSYSIAKEIWNVMKKVISDIDSDYDIDYCEDDDVIV